MNARARRLKQSSCLTVAAFLAPLSSLLTMKTKSKDSGKLKIGDDWNAIRIIALSQSNPLKAIAEFVENSIDAHAKTITITRPAREGAPAMTDFLRSAVPPPRIDTFALQTA